jgi:TPR repeat protein
MNTLAAATLAWLLCAPAAAQDATRLIAQCDRHAASPFDPERPESVGGVSTVAIDAKAALPACLAATKAAPTDRRVLFQLGRALEAARQDDKARSAYRLASDLGHLPAATSLAVLLERGRGGSADTSEARKLYEKSAAGGYAPGMSAMGRVLKEGIGGAKDEEAGRRWMRDSIMAFVKVFPNSSGRLQQRRLHEMNAAGGDASAMTYLGVKLERGEDGPKDLAAAERWYRHAAEAGNAEGMFYLAVLLEDGRGVPRDEAQARLWYERSAAGGLHEAMNNLGSLHVNGRGGPKDEAQALRWFEKAAAMGNAMAMNKLGILHELGMGTRPDSATALRWYEKAAERGSKEAAANLNRLRKALR